MGRSIEALANNIRQFSQKKDHFGFKNVKFAIAGRIAMATIALSGSSCSSNDVEKSNLPKLESITVSQSETAREIFSSFLSKNLTQTALRDITKITITEDDKVKNTFSASWDTGGATFATSPDEPEQLSYLFLDICQVPIFLDSYSHFL